MKEGFKNNRGFCIWLTGLPCAGKTSIANKLYERLSQHSYKVKLFDGDEVRKTISKDLGFSKADRIENMKRVATIVKEFVNEGYIVICALVSPYKEERNKVRQMFMNSNFIEVFVDAPLEVCEKRDTKGMYKKARAGLIKNFTGIDDPYELPENPEIHLKTNILSLEESVNLIIKFIIDNKLKS